MKAAKKLTILTASTALVLTALTATAATVTVSDPNSDFEVTYDDSEAGAFGVLFLSNNTIFFLPDNFATTSLNEEGATMIAETLNLRLDATTPGFTFENFLLVEEGDYIVNGADTEVSASGEMRVRDFDNPLVTFRSGFSFVDSGDGGPGTQQWSGTAELGAADGWTGAPNGVVLLTLQNVLTATSITNGENAFIQKKMEGVQIQVNPVPVPAAVWLFGSALLALGYRGRRKD